MTGDESSRTKGNSWIFASSCGRDSFITMLPRGVNVPIPKLRALAVRGGVTINGLALLPGMSAMAANAIEHIMAKDRERRWPSIAKG
jgi:hypothetical protein